MNVLVHLYPPLNNTAGQSRVKLSLEGEVTIQRVVDALVERFGPDFRQHLYDTEDCFIPTWYAFVNQQPVQLSRPEGLLTTLEDSDEVSFLMNIAGG